MKNIEIITIQQKSVLDAILSDGVYYANTEEYITKKKSNLLSPYKLMVSEYGYKHFPIFGCAINHYCEFYGCKTDGEPVLIQLSIPESEVRVQNYYDWVDLIYFTEFPGEWGSGAAMDFASFCHYTLLERSLQNIGRDACQITVEKIKKEWFVNSKPLPQGFIDTHVGSGGKNILRNIDQYN